MSFGHKIKIHNALEKGVRKELRAGTDDHGSKNRHVSAKFRWHMSVLQNRETTYTGKSRITRFWWKHWRRVGHVERVGGNLVFSKLWKRVSSDTPIFLCRYGCHRLLLLSAVSFSILSLYSSSLLFVAAIIIFKALVL